MYTTMTCRKRNSVKANKQIDADDSYNASPNIRMVTPSDIGLRRYRNGPKATNSLGRNRLCGVMPRVLRMPPDTKTKKPPEIKKIQAGMRVQEGSEMPR